MSESIEDHLSELRNILLALEATGERGFEGLIGAALSEIAGQPFRLASSGSQRGRDGESSFDAGAIYFEAKLYSGRLPKDPVLSRITEAGLGVRGHNVDVWVLASTQEVSAQHCELYRLAAERLGMGLLLLDWSHLSLPPLAVALAAGSEGTSGFFARQPNAGSSLQAVTRILDAITKHRGYRDYADKLRAKACSPAIGVSLAAAKSSG